jgi:hypothetical protein
MGYSTDFRGALEFNKPLTDEMIETYAKFKDTRHANGYQPNGQPSIWLGWEIVEKDSVYYLEWDGGEKFNKYTEWLEYVIKYIFKGWGLELNGSIEWRGDRWDDLGLIDVTNNKVEVRIGDLQFQ